MPISTRTALVKSRIPGVTYAINPYLGCEHGCRYCYAVFMRKYSHGHQGSRWGDFVEVKANIAQVLRAELAKKRTTGRVMLSSVCDPYQPVETHYRLTRQCLEVLREFGWGVDILTRSRLVTRDVDLLRSMVDLSVGFSIPTDMESVREVLEPQAPSIASRVAALRELHEAGISTWVFVAPVLPMDPVNLCRLIAPYTESVMVDALNYSSQVAPVFRENDWAYALTAEYARQSTGKIMKCLGKKVSRV